jgi:hypothetical protein
LALKFADLELRKNVDLIKLAVKHNVDALAFAIYPPKKQNARKTDEEKEKEKIDLDKHREIAINALNTN